MATKADRHKVMAEAVLREQRDTPAGSVLAAQAAALRFRIESTMAQMEYLKEIRDLLARIETKT